MTIGIPRALFYWKKPGFWQTFFEGLGCDVLLSSKTNKEIIEIGIKVSDPETCFSNKVFFGHLLWLEGKCDYIFVPLLKTDKQGLEYCPKFFGLPDLAKILTKTRILTEIFDERKRKFEKTLEKLGRQLVKDKKVIKKAIEMAFLKELEIKEKRKQNFNEKIKSERKKIILVSHPYNLYDEYVNLDIEKKLKDLGAEPIFIDEIPFRVNPRQSVSIPKFHWEFGKEIMEKIETILDYDTCPAGGGVAGAIELSSFQCGCDAVLKEFIEKEFKLRKIPFLYLILDEQTGQAGFQTRLEAFMDTLK